MGSGQSHPANDDATGKISTSSTKASHTTDTISSSSPPDSSPPTATKKKPIRNESGYARAQRVCRKKKGAYDACYTDQLASKEENCDDLFESYHTCFLRVMAKDMEKRGVAVSENSMIGEYKEEAMDEEENNR
mmetsp:Transcript_8357/g.15156  ORF Transcript_8357/g.15156 Transcript_8357/m.15156 type:complete len:133 (-) Transcript_8357:132-530(-)|eukprot:CAMPEP_0201943406 /NCGR_PEP_ID=MMETSP0903-20130614/51045_1 /ASSEMBLY_ACC=CAM_ASM_000552 /TAXON_ID=420261 /ORGANISM="Thalassiosira antarctica, Strain CCMP982" /LENGTH=132 /DNA_ID=CAMNT_0048486081 /DNA_START=86 /DNA_END=484 /DNA_ORIENTATION=-